MNKTERNEKLEFGKKILTASMGQCVHVAGSYNFIQIAQNLGYNCKFLGPAVETSKIIEEIQNFKPEIVGLSYRLTSATLKPLLASFFDQYKKLAKKPKKLYFAGTPEVVNIARKFGKFDHFFIGGESNFDVISVLRDSREDYEETQNIPLSLIERIEWKKPYPIIRAHFGLPDFDETVNGIREIAKSKVLDVISIAPDQNTQANFFHPEEQLEHLSGAGGVPLRSRDDLLELHEARLTGNYPMLRIYAGTRDFIKLGKLFDQTIKNAWAAIPIFWFNQMDGRGL